MEEKMIQYVFETSAIINLLRHGQAKVFLKGTTLDHAFYECLDILTKQFIRNRIKGYDKLTSLIEVLKIVFEVLQTVSIRGMEKEVIDLAVKENISVIEASYIQYARSKGLILVTDNPYLYEVASKYVNVLRSDELLIKFSLST
ncbi:MAG: hypothetical protein J7L82_03230 [Staphylothermus sp.]|nr:hypothetical protein [Staphylothermus sp.]